MGGDDGPANRESHSDSSSLCGVEALENAVAGVRLDARTHTAIAIAAIDNLGRGAAGQAVQNMNLMFGLPETTGLRFPGLFP